MFLPKTYCILYTKVHKKILQLQKTGRSSSQRNPDKTFTCLRRKLVEYPSSQLRTLSNKDIREKTFKEYFNLTKPQ